MVGSIRIFIGHEDGFITVKDFILVGILETVIGNDTILLAPFLQGDGVGFRILAQLLKDSDGSHVIGVILVEKHREPVCGRAFVFLLIVLLGGLVIILVSLECDRLVELGPSHLDDSGFRVS